jgi:hypothetical protein
MGLYSLLGLDRYSVLTGLTENINLTGNMSDHEDKKDLAQPIYEKQIEYTFEVNYADSKIYLL